MQRGSHIPVKIVVCLKPVPDTSKVLRLDPQSQRLQRTPDQTIINPFDEFALEAALRLRDAGEAQSVTVLALAPLFAKETLRKALAIGADDAVLISDEHFAGSDGLATAKILRAALRLIGFDVVLCGTQSADGGGAYMPTMLAQLLDIPAMTAMRTLGLQSGMLRGERNVDGRRALACTPPVLASISKESAAPRYASLKGIMAAKKKEIRIVTAAELAVDNTAASTEVLSAREPAARGSARILQAADSVAAASQILAFLRERHAL